ncbi:MAG: hypothetical protein WCQ21_21035, partial [Verrucomicrobiota bacterium]
TGGAGAGITLMDPVTLGADIRMDASGGLGSVANGVAGNIDFQSTLDGLHTLNLDASGATDGDIHFHGIVGATALGAVTIDDAKDVTAYAAFSAASLTQTAGSGTTMLDGLTTLTGKLDITTVNIDIDDSVTTASGLVDLNATTSVDLAADKTITTTAGANTGTTSGAIDIDVSGTGTVNIAGDLVTTGAANNAGVGSVGGAVTIDTVGGVIAVKNITTTGGAGTDNNGGAAGVITLNTGGEAITLNGNLSAVGGASASATGGAGAGITLMDPVTLGADITVYANGGIGTIANGSGGDIDFQSTINGAKTLNLVAGTGDVSVTGVVGTSAASGNRLTSFTVTSAATADLDDVFTSGVQSVTATNIHLNGTTYTSTGEALTFTGATVAPYNSREVLELLLTATNAKEMKREDMYGHAARHFSGEIPNPKALAGTPCLRRLPTGPPRHDRALAQDGILDPKPRSDAATLRAGRHQGLQV